MTSVPQARIVHSVAELATWLASGDGTVLVVMDEGIVGTAVDREVRRAVRRSGVSAERRVITHQSRLPAVLDIADRIRGDVTVLAVGGGGVVDQAKLGTLLAGDRGIERVLRRPHRCGLVAMPLGARRRHRFATVLTTVGTGTHVSPNACLEVDGRKRLFSSPALRPDVSVVDPVATASLPGWLLLEGVLENVARLAGVYVGSNEDVDYPSDGDVEGLARALVAIGYEARAALSMGRTPAAGLRAELAYLSGRTHRADLAAGRENYVDKSWPLGHELSAALGLRKVQAMSSLLVPLWRRIEGGHDGFGSGPRLARFWSRTALAVRASLPRLPSAGLQLLMTDWDIDAEGPARAVALSGSSVPAEAHRLADRTWQSWGHRLPMLRGLSVDEVRGLYADCLAPGPRQGAATHVRVFTPGPSHPAAVRHPVTTSPRERR